MADRSDPVDGLLIPDPRVVLVSTLAANDGSSTGSDYSEATPRPGISVPSSPTSKLAPQISGAQAVDVDLQVVAAGLPELTDGVELAYRADGDTAAEWRGWLSPNFLAGVANATFDTAVRDAFDLAVIPSTGEVILVVGNTSLTGCQLWDPTDWAWTAKTAVPVVATAPSCLVLPGSERVLYLALPLQQMYSSDDKGTTWDRYSEDVFRGTSLSVSTVGARMHLVGSDISLVTYTTTQVTQWVSTDLGATFDQVDLDAALGSSYTTAQSGGKLVLGYARTADSYPCVRIVGAAGAVLADADEVIIDSAACDELELVDQDGVLWAYIRTGEAIATWFSANQGLTWTQTDYGAVETASASDYPTNFRALATAGHVLLCCNSVASASSYDGSILGLVLGGWSTTTNGALSNVHRLDTRPAWGPHASDVCWTWLPSELPQNNGWTRAGAGGTTTLVSPGAVQIVTAAAQDYYALGLGIPASSAVSRSVEFELKVDSSSGGLAARDTGLLLQAAEGTNDLALGINLTTTGFRVEDAHAASTLVDVVIDMTEPLIIWAHVGPAPSSGYQALVYYRRAGETKWTEAYAGAITSNTSTPAGSAQVQWGHIVSGSADSTWYWLAAGGGKPLADISDDLNGKPVSTAPAAVPDLAGGSGLDLAHLSAHAGPGVIDEQWTVPRRHDYAIANLLPSIQASPAVGWRSQDTTEQILTWDFGAKTWLGNSIGLLLHKVNFFQAVLEYWDGAAWQTAGTADLRLPNIGSMAVDGDAVRPTGGTGGFVGENELVGGSVHLNLGSGVKARTIRSNSAGVFTGASTTKQAEILIDGADGTEPAAPVTNSVVVPSGVLVVHLSAAVHARYWRVRIPAQTCPDSYFRAGVILPMRLQPFGASSSWGGGLQWAANTERSTSRYGTTRAREKGPVAASWTLGWPDPTEQWRIRSLTDLPYVGVSGGLPLGVGDDVARLLRGVLVETKGGELPVVGLASIPSSTSTIRDQSLFLYGRLTGSVAAAHQQGDPGRNELSRVENITLDELV